MLAIDHAKPFIFDSKLKKLNENLPKYNPAKMREISKKILVRRARLLCNLFPVELKKKVMKTEMIKATLHILYIFFHSRNKMEQSSVLMHGLLTAIPNKYVRF